MYYTIIVCIQKVLVKLVKQHASGVHTAVQRWCSESEGRLETIKVRHEQGVALCARRRIMRKALHYAQAFLSKRYAVGL